MTAAAPTTCWATRVLKGAFGSTLAAYGQYLALDGENSYSEPPGQDFNGVTVDNATVTLYENGILHIVSAQEETTTHLQNCEVLWRFEVDGEDRAKDQEQYDRLRHTVVDRGGASGS